MRYNRDLSRWWSVGRGLTRADLAMLLLLFVLLAALSGCGTTHSTSAYLKPSAPAAITDAIPPPVYLPGGEAAPEDLLDNLAINAEIANELRSRLRAIKVWAKSIGAMK